MNNNIGRIAGIAAALALLLISGTAFAQTPPGQGGYQGGQGRAGHQGGYTGQGGMPGRGSGMRPGVFGTVSAINGDSLTVTSKSFGKNATSTPPTTYTVDATNATVFKNNATSTLSVVVVGDTVAIQGTVSGTSVTATTIRDGVVPMMGARGGQGGPGSSTQMHGGWPGSASSTSSNPPKGMSGFMHAIGGFFHSLFGFL